jgi:hypothetical protein
MHVCVHVHVHVRVHVHVCALCSIAVCCTCYACTFCEYSDSSKKSGVSVDSKSPDIVCFPFISLMFSSRTQPSFAL